MLQPPILVALGQQQPNRFASRLLRAHLRLVVHPAAPEAPQAVALSVQLILIRRLHLSAAAAPPLGRLRLGRQVASPPLLLQQRHPERRPPQTGPLHAQARQLAELHHQHHLV